MSTKINTLFQRTFWIVMTILVIAIFLLDVLIGVQGQRIRNGVIDTDAATKDRNQKIVLSLSLPVQSINKDQATITPAASFTALAKGDSIVIQLKERLAYGTQYEVKLSKLRAINGHESERELKYTFSTKPASFYYLKRNYEAAQEGQFYAGKQQDEIRRSEPQGHDETVFKASGIQEYCLLKDDLIVATLNDDNTNQLFRINHSTLKKEELSLPEKGIATLLRCAPTKDTYGFVFEGKSGSNSKYSSVLFTGKITDEASKSTAVIGINKKPLEVSDWEFAPDGTSILAHSYGGGVVLIDGLKLHDTLPLGRFYDIGNFNFDGHSFITSGPDGLLLFNIPKFSQTTVSSQLDETQPTSAYPLQNSDGLIERVYIPGSTIVLPGADTLTLRRDGATKTLYEAKDAGSILSYTTSPNDQYLVVTLAKSSEIEYGLYNRRPMSKDTKTEIIDMKTLETVKTIDGFDVTWR